MKQIITIFISIILMATILGSPIMAQGLESNKVNLIAPVELSLAPGEQYCEQVVWISDEIRLVYTLRSEAIDDVIPFRSTIRRKLTSVCTVKNKAGDSIGTITAVGVFDTNGNTSKPQDAYGYGQVERYTIENQSNAKSSEQFYAWVRISLNGVPNGPVRAFSHICVINCDANGQSSATWD